VHFVPVTNFASYRDDVRLADLREVLAPASWADEVRGLLPSANVVTVEDAAILARVRSMRDATALVTPDLVDATVKTLSVDRLFYWDRAIDLARYPLQLSTHRSAQMPEREAVWEMLGAGDIVFARGVAERILRYGGDPTRPFHPTRHLTRAADLAVANLEGALSGYDSRYCNSCMVFVGNERWASALADAGFDIMSLANNHIGDGGRAGVLNSARALEAAGIAHFGAGADEAAARRPTVVTVRGLRVAFVGYTDVPPVEYGAGPGKPGSARLSHDDASYARIRQEIAAAKANADLVVVVPHWGIEYEDRPRPWIVAAARAMVEAGADVILGGHPHWVQNVEFYRGKYITYSVGNYVFDQMWSTETRQGSFHRLFFSGTRLVSVRIVPFLIEDFHQPRLYRTDEAGYRQTLERIWKHSTFGN
jgi:poly-gamma-glutamate capsule biosynthesis protein CapA/YwtB (metallophosphatase superfamily)